MAWQQMNRYQILKNPDRVLVSAEDAERLFWEKEGVTLNNDGSLTIDFSSRVAKEAHYDYLIMRACCALEVTSSA